MPEANSKRASIVFFGAGPVATTSLEFLASMFDIEAVITKSRPPHHHGQVPVLEWCEGHNVPTYTPANKAELSEIFANHPFHSPVGVVIDYGIIMSHYVIDTFPLGIVNSHFSLLPEWRGADPITFAILSGQHTTGVSLMLINEKMDEGALLAQATYDITDNETTATLTEGLIELSNHLLAETLPVYLNGSLVPYEQSEYGPSGLTLPTSYSRKLTKADGTIDWQKPAEQIEREIRAFAGWPGNRTNFNGIDVIITAAHVRADLLGDQPGEIVVIGSKELLVCTGIGTLVIDQLKPAGKAEMSAKAFLAGYKARLV
jgi:methionyl-tRNA formyltransferase